MSLSILGRRYERLLFFAAPLSLASVLILFVAFATETQKERATARCYENGAKLPATEAAKSAWSDFIVAKRSALAMIAYQYNLRQLLIIEGRLASDCYTPLLDEIVPRAKEGPQALILSLQQEAARLSATPIKYPGVEIPEKANMSLMGTAIAIDLTLFARLLQVVLAPLMLLWLGSLYNTRYRESLLIENAKLVTDVFPHLINVYPAIRYPEPRRRSYLQPYYKHIFAFIYACVRAGLLLMFVGPAVLAYSASIILLSANNYSTLIACLAVLVVLFASALLLCEFFPWHYNKTFPGRPLIKGQ